MARREKGSATLPCPTCGKSLAASEQPDGSLAAETCSKCHPKTEAAAAKADERLREQGTDVEGATA
jgi:hypothetical protein